MKTYRYNFSSKTLEVYQQNHNRASSLGQYLRVAYNQIALAILTDCRGGTMAKAHYLAFASAHVMPRCNLMGTWEITDFEIGAWLSTRRGVKG